MPPRTPSAFASFRTQVFGAHSLTVGIQSWLSGARLGLSLRGRLHAWLASGALLIAYVATMARDLSLYDSPELALAAVSLGLGHPPGQPLHTLVGHVFTYLPVSAAIATGLASAVPGALCVIPATAIAQQLAGDRIDRRVDAMLPWLLAAIGLMPALWEPATRVEVYALATFFGLWSVARLAPLGRGSRDVFVAAVGLGLCASANPMIAWWIAVAVGPSLLSAVLARTLPLRVVPLALVGGVIGLLPYAYVPLIAQRQQVLVWGAPRDAASLSAFFLLRDYASNLTMTFATWAAHVVAFIPHSFTHGLAAIIALGIAAHALLGARLALGRWTAALLSALLVAQISFNAVWSLEVPDYDGYLATGLWLLAAGAAALCGHAFERGQRALAAGLALLIVTSAWLTPPALYARTRHLDHVARTLAERVLHEAPPGAIVISRADAFSAALLYLQEAERQRSDVVVLAFGLASSSWHWERIYQLHPDLAPFALRGPGQRDGRIARFLAANARRVVLLESLRIAQSIQRRACAGGLYLRSGPQCDQSADVHEQRAATDLLAQQLAIVGTGSPSAAGAIAASSAELGESLWRLGAPVEAYRALLAGVPVALAPVEASQSAGLERAPALSVTLAPWRRVAALGDPARNLFLASVLAQTAGRSELATQLLVAAAQQGLPEALDLVPSPQ